MNKSKKKQYQNKSKKNQYQNKSKKKQYQNKSKKKRSMKGGRPGAREKRLSREFTENPITNQFVSISPEQIPLPNNKLQINAELSFQPDSVYSEGKFIVKIIVPNDYPFRGPEIFITTPMYHPCVDSSGRISYDFIADLWTPSFTLFDTLNKIQDNLYTFDTENMHVFTDNKDMYDLFLTNRDEFNRNARDHTIRNAIPLP
jgi:ubiquitin-conjugating enzyme E2 H